jgi:hypothetical protein
MLSMTLTNKDNMGAYRILYVPTLKLLKKITFSGRLLEFETAKAAFDWLEKTTEIDDSDREFFRVIKFVDKDLEANLKLESDKFFKFLAKLSWHLQMEWYSASASELDEVVKNFKEFLETYK